MNKRIEARSPHKFTMDMTEQDWVRPGDAIEIVPYPGWRIRFDYGVMRHEKIPSLWQRICEFFK